MSAPGAIATIEQRVRELDAADAPPLAELMTGDAPVIVRGLVADWPMVRAGEQGAEVAMAYLRRFDGGRAVTAFTGAPEIGGRFFYNDDLTAFNFAAERTPLADCLARIAGALGDADAGALYIGSTDLDGYLPGFRTENDLALGRDALASIWIGNRTVAAAHWDMSNNIACCLVGERRFTLFPPDQAANLYPGPLDPTPGGQVVSMVDLAAPDLDRHPRAADALAAAQVAELQPGDVLIYPALWWHQVEALAPFNVMVNYWWNDAAPFLDTPMTTLLHALLSLRDRPDAEKQAWRHLFDLYVFGPAAAARDHLPEHARGPLAPLDAATARRLRAQVANRLNR